MIYLVLILAQLLLVIPEGLLVQTLFTWFLTPHLNFTLTFSESVGLSLLFGLITWQPTVMAHLTDKQRTEHLFDALLQQVVLYVMFFAIAWFVHV